MKLHIRKGDTVMVIAGDSRGQQGKVLRVDTEKYKAIVEGVNMVKNTDTSGGLPDHTQGDICFLLHMQYPYNWEETGTASFRPSEVFTGIYRVTKIVSNFSNGQFTQTLAVVLQRIMRL